MVALIVPLAGRLIPHRKLHFGQRFRIAHTGIDDQRTRATCPVGRQQVTKVSCRCIPR